MSDEKTRSRKRPSPRYVVGNPRGLAGHIIRQGERRWYEGEEFDGKVEPRLVEQGFLVEVSDAID